MEEKTKQLFKAYLSLSETEKNNFKKALQEYDSKNIFEQRNYSETLNKSLGPIAGAKCAVCGK